MDLDDGNITSSTSPLRLLRPLAMDLESRKSFPMIPFDHIY